MAVGASQLHESDIAVIIIYFAFILFIGLWMSRKNRGSISGYFLAGRNMHWVMIGASLFASNVGSLHFVGLAGSGAEAGIGVANYELNAIFVLVMLGWLFLPVYIASGVFTMPEYIRKRYGGQRIRVYLAVLSLLVYVFTKISADLYAGAIFIEQALRWDIYSAIILLLVVAAVFTITGGLTAVMWTDFIQTIIMMVGAVALTILAFLEVGGFEAMTYQYARAIPDTTRAGNDTCGFPRPDAMHLVRDPVDSDLPWPGVIGLTINSVWYWCADQVIVQRTLAAKNYSHAKAGTIFAGYIKLLPLFLLVFPGMIARILFPNEVGCVDPAVCWEVCKSRAGCSNIAYPMLVIKLMPHGARGIMLAVMLSALMSSLTSIFNSSSTIFTVDIWRRVRQNASDVELMIVGRLCVLALVVVSILWVPIIQASQGTQLFVYIQQVSSYLQPPICAVYVLSVFWSRSTEQGAFWALTLGLLIGIIRFVLEFIHPVPTCFEGGEDPRFTIVKNFHYLYFAIFLFGITMLICVIVSLMTEPIDKKHLYRLTYWSRHSKEHREDMDVAAANEAEAELVTGGGEGGKDTFAICEPIVEVPLPLWKRIGYWVCGIEDMYAKANDNKSIDEGEDEAQREVGDKMLDISEKTWVKNVLNVNAVILLAMAIFLWAFFG